MGLSFRQNSKCITRITFSCVYIKRGASFYIHLLVELQAPWINDDFVAANVGCHNPRWIPSICWVCRLYCSYPDVVRSIFRQLVQPEGSFELGGVLFAEAAGQDRKNTNKVSKARPFSALVKSDVAVWMHCLQVATAWRVVLFCQRCGESRTGTHCINLDQCSTSST